MENNEEIDIKRIIEIIFSKKLIITLIILLSVTLGYVYSYYYKKPEYKSSVTILLVADENKTDKSLTQTDVNLNNGLISTYSSIAKSSSILQKTIQNLNLDIPVSKLEQNVEAKQIDNTQFLEISVKNESPERAKNIANELAEVFTEQIKEIYNLQNISIVDKAETEENPCNINHMKDMIIFGFAGIVLSIIIVMIIYMFDDTVKEQKDIEKNMKNGKITKTGLPTSNVLYYELENNNWCCVRPSGTEPKIKLYMGVKARSEKKATEKLELLKEAMVKVVTE